MQKFYYVDLGATPFAKLHILNEELKELPKYWKRITEEEAQYLVKK